jgi:hypothetical protein
MDLIAEAARRRGVLTTAEATAAGLTAAGVRSLTRVGHLTPVLRGAYVLQRFVSNGSPTLWQKAMAGSLMCTTDAVVVGAAAVALHGIQGGPPSTNIEIRLPSGRTRHQRRDEVRLSWADVPSDDVVDLGGLRVLHPVAALRDTAVGWSREHAVSAFDSALNQGVVGARELAQLAAAEQTLAPWIALADSRAESPLETRSRLIWHDGGVPPDALQHEVRVNGRVIARLDAAWMRHGVKLAAECDGHGPHDKPEALYRDRARQADLQALGWHVIRVTWEDVMHRPRVVLDRVLRELLRVA